MKKIISLLIILFSSTIFAAEAPKFSITSTSFLDAGAIPDLYTCEGKNISPEVEWTTLPAKTQSLALILSDPDAPGGTFYHWIVYNIDPKAKLDEGVEKYPSGTLVGKNSFGTTKYQGPCPPKGSVHTYIFTLYALSKKLSLPAGADAKTVLDQIKASTIAQTKITAVYTRWFT